MIKEALFVKQVEMAKEEEETVKTILLEDERIVEGGEIIEDSFEDELKI